MDRSFRTVDYLMGDCLVEMDRLAPSSVDLILADLPYGITQQPWDCDIDIDALWRHYLRLAKPDATFVLTAAQPFTSALVMSQPRLFKYDYVWKKPKGTGHLNAKKQPMRDKEDVLVFARGRPAYNPQMIAGKPYKARGGKRNDDTYGDYDHRRNDNEGLRYPKQVLEFPIVERNKLHPSQKPLDLIRWLIRTHSNVGAVVLDNAMGGGTTGEAALLENRRFIGIEKDENYYKLARIRISECAADILADENIANQMSEAE